MKSERRRREEAEETAREIQESFHQALDRTRREAEVIGGNSGCWSLEDDDEPLISLQAEAFMKSNRMHILLSQADEERELRTRIVEKRYALNASPVIGNLRFHHR